MSVRKILQKAPLYGRTIKKLKPIQVYGLALRKLRHRKLKKYAWAGKIENVSIVFPKLDEDEQYLGRFHVDSLMRGEVELLHETHAFDDSWKANGASHLWNFNLQYLEFTIPLAVMWKKTGDGGYKDKWIGYICSWLEYGSKADDAKEPYTASVRIVNILIGLEMIGEISASLKNRIYGSLYDQYRFLQDNLETALLANHYFENLKALVIGAVLFCEERKYRKYFKLFLQQIKEQILDDGFHYERSPMYHKIVLEDVLRVYKALGQVYPFDAKKIEPVIKAMLEALKSLEEGFCATPLFNDSGDNVSKNMGSLIQAGSLVCGIYAGMLKTTDSLSKAGYYRLDQGDCAILFDCGEIGPAYMGGHAHNDCLSFELGMHGKKIFSNSGTGQYQGGLRSFFRSTAAHNTVMVDEREQNELWGEHRAAGCGSGYRVLRSANAIKGSFRSFKGDKYSRKLKWRANSLVIKDCIQSKGKHIARQFFHLAPGLSYERKNNCVRILDDKIILAAIVLPKGSDSLIHREGALTNYASDFGKYEKKQVLEIRSFFQDWKEVTLEIKIYG